MLQMNHPPHPTVPEIVCALLRTSLWQHPCPSFENCDWTDVHTELVNQAVPHLVSNTLAALDSAHQALYFKQAVHNISHWKKIMSRQQDLVNLLHNSNIPFVILKGSASGYFYPEPMDRLMGDIDLLVKPEDFNRALELLLRSGEYVSENFRHISLNIHGIHVELHRAYSMFNDQIRNDMLDTLLFRAIDHARYVSIDQYHFPMLPSLENGLVLLSHISTHLENGLGLRQIVDWMMYVHQELTDEFWHDQFEPIVKSLGLHTLAVTVTRMCQIYLGLPSDLTWCTSADTQLCSNLLDYVFQQGNFGKKLPKGFNQTTSVLHTAKNMHSLFRALQYRGCINWKAAKKHPWLKPFAWLYQGFRYLHAGLQLKHPISFLRNVFSQENRHDTLLDQLGVYRMKNEK